MVLLYYVLLKFPFFIPFFKNVRFFVAFTLFAILFLSCFAFEGHACTYLSENLAHVPIESNWKILEAGSSTWSGTAPAPRRFSRGTRSLYRNNNKNKGSCACQYANQVAVHSVNPALSLPSFSPPLSPTFSHSLSLLLPRCISLALYEHVTIENWKFMNCALIKIFVIDFTNIYAK